MKNRSNISKPKLLILTGTKYELVANHSLVIVNKYSRTSALEMLEHDPK